MFLDDFVHVAFVAIAIPNALGIDDKTRTEFAAIQATGLINAQLAGPGQLQFFDALLGVIAQARRAFVVATTARMPGLTLVAAEKNVVRIKGFVHAAQCYQ